MKYMRVLTLMLACVFCMMSCNKGTEKKYDKVQIGLVVIDSDKSSVTSVTFNGQTKNLSPMPAGQIKYHDMFTANANESVEVKWTTNTIPKGKSDHFTPGSDYPVRLIRIRGDSYELLQVTEEQFHEYVGSK